jgi:hypothetical protein
VEHSIEKEWIEWVKNTFIPEFYRTGNFSKAVFAKVISHTDETGNTYSLQCYAKDKNELDNFHKNYSEKLAQLISGKFGARVLSFKTELELIETFDF